MSSIADLDLAKLPSVQVESPEETWANPRETDSDRETVFDVGMEIAVYQDDRMENQV